ncbi:hypothetical protein L6164_007049 [Bauhinia variegata]|uniref:Uncharacterized protein n=1 Tax=Bauhinia variegata TaxID=167791 RepID=A0ACB9Q1U0_BAUVA|nr:hypothetical protein L6164_007049 [Bauhinia variegata]
MTHRIDVEATNGGDQQPNPQFQGPNKLVSTSAVLYMVIRAGSTTSHFTSTLEEVCRYHKLDLTEVIDHVSCAGDTLLHMAVKYGKHNIVQHLADEFPQLITKANVKGDTPLHVAARSGDLSLVKVILEAYAKHSPNSKEELCKRTNDFGNTPLHEAVVKNHFAAAQMLYNVNKLVALYLNKEDKSPLYLAVESGKKELVYLLLKAPIENHDKIQKGKSPLLAAIMRIHQGERKKRIVYGPMAEGWLKNPARLPSFPRTESSPKEYLAILDDILKARPELKYIKDKTGGTPLHCAALLGHLEGVRKLLAEDPSSALEWNTKGYLPIHLASKKGHVSVVKEILEKIASLDPIDLLNRKGQNILHMAAKNGKHEVVKYILREKKLEQLLNEKDKKGNTPLHSASKYLHPKVLLLLTRDKRVDVKLANNLGMTARDVVLQQIEVPLTFRELLSSEILFYAGTHLSEKGKRFGREGLLKRPQVHWIKDQISTLMLVTILVATVTFAAGFTVPGGFIDSGPDMKAIGVAALINRLMFKVFIICDVVAMYSSTFAAFILLWAQLGDFHMAISATHFALLLVAVALVTMSTAFMAAVHLIVRNLSWLAYTVIIMGFIFLSMFLVVFALLMFPIGAPIPLLSYIANIIFRMMIPFSGSYTKVKRRKVQGNSSKPTQAQTQDEQLQAIFLGSYRFTVLDDVAKYQPLNGVISESYNHI